MNRGHWGTRAGFILAAAGSAIGLGNIWKFPYIAGEHGGGAFVLLYLAFVALIGVPVMITEIMLGRSTQQSPVGALRKLSAPGSPWILVAGLGVLAGAVTLSFYSVVAGWSLHYGFLSATGGMPEAADAGARFQAVTSDPLVSVGWMVAFLVLTTFIVSGGVRQGIERASRWLMPALGFLLLVLLFRAFSNDGFGRAVDFVFGAHWDRMTPGGVLDALGHAMFTLSVGIGGMIAYGSYLDKDTDIIETSFIIALLDTAVAVLACMVFFPFVFGAGLSPEKGPGLVFISLPVAFDGMPAGRAFGFVFFVLLVFAALSSAVALLEIVVSHLVDEKHWSRKKAAWTAGAAITILGIPAALSSTSWAIDPSALTGRDWFTSAADFVTSICLPFCGMGFALFMGWRVEAGLRQNELDRGALAWFFKPWLFLIRWVVPLAILAVALNSFGLLSGIVPGF